MLAAAFAQQPAIVEGEVRNSVTGEPIVRAHVAVVRYVNGNREHWGTYTNAEGKFTLVNIPAGNEYSFAFERTGFVRPLVAESPFGLATGERKDNVKLLLTPTGAIAGHVLDADGVPVEGIVVEAQRGHNVASATTDDQGKFRLGGLRPGKYRVEAQVQHFPLPPETSAPMGRLR